MIRQKFLPRLLATLGVAVIMVMAVVLGAFAVNSTHTHAANSKNMFTPRFVHFHKNFSPANIAHTKVTHWSSTFASGGITYTYTMVGTNPRKGSATSTIATTIVPLIMRFSNGTVFDGTQKVAGTTGSPIFQPAPFSSGTTQYGDAIQRAEFWNSVSTTSPNYHVLLGNPTIAPALVISVPAASGATTTDPYTGETIGIADINWLDPLLQSLFTSSSTARNYNPSRLPIFLSNNVYLSVGSPNLNNCCIGGYHSATTTNNGLQTYIWTNNADEGVLGGFAEDVSALSHELAEWMNDPFVNNVVPNWQSPIAPQYGCNNFLEVGDPLVGVLFTVNGYDSSHLQDEAFFSWFARQSPSIGINGQYTYLNTFSQLSQPC